jgi:hypothetical protein
MHFGTGLGFVRTLALRREILLYRQVYTMVVWLYGEYIVRQFNRAACLCTFTI